MRYFIQIQHSSKKLPPGHGFWVCMHCRGVTIQEKRIAIYCDIFSLYCDILRYIPFLIFSVKSNKFLNIRLNFRPYVIKSELYTCIHDCMKTFYKGIYVTGIHLLDLQLLPDKN